MKLIFDRPKDKKVRRINAMAITGELANIVVNTNYNDIPKEAIEDTNDLVIGFIGD